MKKHKTTQERYLSVKISERDLLCLWAATQLRNPEPLTRLLKKILEPTVEKNWIKNGGKWNVDIRGKQYETQKNVKTN